MPGPAPLASPKSETFTAALPRKLILNGRHLLPPIVLFQNRFSYKQGGLAGPRSRMHSAVMRDRESAFGACTLGRQDSYCGEFLRHRKDVQKIESGHRNLGMNCNQMESLKIVHRVTGSDLHFSRHGNGGNSGHPRGAGEGVIWVLLADIFPGVPDCCRWQEVPAQASSWAFLQELTLSYCTGARCQSSRERRVTYKKAQPVLHNNLDI